MLVIASAALSPLSLELAIAGGLRFQSLVLDRHLFLQFHPVDWIKVDVRAALVAVVLLRQGNIRLPTNPYILVLVVPPVTLHSTQKTTVRGHSVCSFLGRKRLTVPSSPGLASSRRQKNKRERKADLRCTDSS